jgi:hypothetical protein
MVVSNPDLCIDYDNKKVLSFSSRKHGQDITLNTSSAFTTAVKAIAIEMTQISFNFTRKIKSRTLITEHGRTPERISRLWWALRLVGKQTWRDKTTFLCFKMPVITSEIQEATSEENQKSAGAHPLRPWVKMNLQY